MVLVVTPRDTCSPCVRGHSSKRSGTLLLVLAPWLLLLASDHRHDCGIGGVEGWTAAARPLDATTTTRRRRLFLLESATTRTSVEVMDVRLGEDNDGAVRTVTTTTAIAPPSSSQSTAAPPPTSPREPHLRPDWWERVLQLRTYRALHGHTQVSRRSDDGLGAWVHKQRQVRACACVV